jgi:hypothetical protein
LRSQNHRACGGEGVIEPRMLESCIGEVGGAEAAARKDELLLKASSIASVSRSTFEEQLLGSRR